MKKILAILVLCLMSITTFGQTDILLTQQIFSRMNFNPAATGASNYTNIFFLGRVQWVGVEGAPTTQYLDVHKYLPLFNSGVGLALVHDEVGLENTFNVKLNYAYHLRLSRESYLSMGLAAGILNRSVSGNKIYQDPSSPNTIYSSENKLAPDFDFGVELGYRNLLLGLSVTHLASKPVNTTEQLLSGRHFYGYAQYHIPVGDWKLSPALIFTNQVNTLNTDVLFIGTYKEAAWIGLSGRFNERFAGTSVSALAGVWILKDLRLGYSYDFNFGGPGNPNQGSHELMLHWRFGGKKIMPARSPRFIEW